MASKKKASSSNGELAVPAENMELATVNAPRLPYHPLIEERFGVDKASWKALVESIFPTATTTESVILALSYCKARKLDPFKRNVHIVPIWDKNEGRMRDTIWPGIGELRTTAFRTGEYAGRTDTRFGPDITKLIGKIEVTFPEWAQVTVRRMVQGQVVEFAGPRVYWQETYAKASRNDDSPNSMWLQRTRGQIDKCAEAAALRAAFPEELGNEYVADEVQHSQPNVIDASPVREQAPASLEDLTDKLEGETDNDHEGAMGNEVSREDVVPQSDSENPELFDKQPHAIEEGI